MLDLKSGFDHGLVETVLWWHKRIQNTSVDSNQKYTLWIYRNLNHFFFLFFAWPRSSGSFFHNKICEGHVIWMPQNTDYGHPMRAFFFKYISQIFLANWADQLNNLWGILGYFGWYCLLKFCHCVSISCPWFGITEPFFSAKSLIFIHFTGFSIWDWDMDWDMDLGCRKFEI